MTANFEVKFIVDRVSGNYKLQITDTSTGFTLAKANTKITFPDGYVVENTDVSNPDISTPGGSIQKNLRLDVLNRVVTGDYTILFTAYDASDNEYTSQKQFNFTWQEPTILIQDLSDAGIPQVKFKDITVWDQGNFTETASARGLSSSYPTTSLISGQSKSASQTNLGEALELDMINSGNYYEGVYPVTLSIDILYSHTNGYLTVQYVKSAVDNVAIKRTPTQTELLTKINTYKERIDAYRTTNPAVYAKLFEEYDNVVALYSHAISRYRIGIGDGAQESIAQILELIDDNIPHSYLATPISAFVMSEVDLGVSQIVAKLEDQIGVFDAEGNLISISKSFADEVFNVEATEFKAEASKLTTLLAQFGTYDPNTDTFTFLATANYFEQVKTYADDDKASATHLSALTSQFGTYDPNTEEFTFEANASYFEQVKTYADSESAAASKVSSLGSVFGGFTGNDFNISEAKITEELNTYTGLNFSNSTYFQNIESDIASRPFVFRQSEAPSVDNPVGSIWYDTNDENKVYVLVAGEPKVWTLTDDSRIGASASKITSMAASFGSFSGNDFTLNNTDSAYWNAVKLYADTNSASAQKIENLGAELVTFDTDNTVQAISLSSNFTLAIDTFVSDIANSTLASKVEGLRVDIEGADGTGGLTASVTSNQQAVAIRPFIFRQDETPSVDNPIGSLWFDTNDNNKAYVLVTGTPNVWTETRDEALISLASSKPFVFRQEEPPATTNPEGSLWYDTNEGNKLYILISETWTNTQDADIATAQSTADGRPKVFRQPEAPDTTEPEFSIWFDTDENNLSYVLIGDGLEPETFTWTQTIDGRVTDLLDFAEARYALTTDAAGVITGMELYSASGPNTAISEVKFTADRFIIKSSTVEATPFVLDVDSLKLNVPLNGVSGSFSGDISAASGTFGDVVIDSDGITATNFSIDTEGNVILSGTITGSTGVFGDVTINSNGITATNFSIDASGNVVLSGTITGSTGVFGDVTIDSSGITATNFSIDTLGNATLAGDITGSSGTFGDVVIDSNGITATNFSIDALGNVVLEGTITGSTGVFGDVTINSTGISATNFSIDALGNATLSGNITGSSGTFGDVVIDSSGITATNFGIDASGNVTLAGTLTGSTGVFGPVTINGNGISSTNFTIDTNGNVTLAGDISGSNGEFSGSLNINDKFLVSSSGAVQVYAGAGATLGSGARFEILDDSGNSKYRLYGGGINFNAWAGGSNAFNSVDALGGGSLFFSDVAHVYAGNGTTTASNHGFTINVDGGSRKMFIKATELRIDPAASDPTNHTTIINGDLEVVGNVSFATTTTGDVTIANLETRLGQIDSDIQIGVNNTVDVTFPGNVQVNGILKGPATFTIDPSAYGDATGKVVILGDLQVDGTTTTINSTVVTVNDKILTLSNGAADSASANDSGIEIAGAEASFKYFHDGTKWVSNKDIQATNFLGNASTASSAAILTTARLIGGVSFNGSANIDLPGVNTEGNQNTTGNAATATTLANARDIALDGAVTGTASFDGSANITITTSVNHNHDDRYYTETESDARFVNVSGDTLTGDLNFNSEVKSRYYAAGLADVNDRYEILGLGNTLMLRYWDNDQGNGTSINSPLMHLEWGGALSNSMVLYGDLILRNEMSVDPEVDVKILDMDVTGGVVNLANINNGTFLGALSAPSITANNTLTVGSTNVYNALPTGLAFTTIDNRFKLQVTTNGGATAETTIAPLLLSDILTEGYVPFVATGDGGGATVNSKVSNSWLKLNADALELGNISDPVNVDAKSIKLSRQIGPGDKQISELKAEGFFVTSTTATFGTKNSSLQFYTNGRLNVNGAFTLPEGDGTSGQVLSTDGSGDLSWTSVNLTETDPIFTASAASGITSTQISNWDTAYGWGNHSTVGYLTSYTETDTLDSVTDRGATTPNVITTGGAIVNGAITLPQNPVGTTYGDGISTVPSYMIQQGAGDNDGIRLYAEAGVYNDVRFIFEVVDDIEDGDTWIFRNKRTYTPFNSIDAVKISGGGDITASGTLSASGYNNSNWDTAYGWGNHATAGYLTSYTETDTLQSVTDRGATTTNSITVGNLTAAQISIDGTFDGNFGYPSFSWAGSSQYPTLYSSHPDRWIMICNIHIPYLENGTSGFAGATQGSNITFASDPSASAYWGMGVNPNNSYTAYDAFGITRNGTPLVTIENNGSFSIGTTSPLLPSSGRGNLSVNGSTDSVVTLGVGGSWSSYYTTNGSATFLASKSGTPIHLEAGGSTKLTIASGGNVGIGIGTNSPVGKLNVALPDDSDGDVRAWSSNQVVFTRGGTSTSQGLGFSVHDVNNTAIISSLTPAVTWSNLEYKALVHTFYSTGATLGIHQDSVGRVGVGATSLTSKLTVAGNLGGVVGGGNSSIRMVNTDTGNYASISAGVVGSTNDGMDFSVDGTRMMVLRQNSLGIGTPTPSYALDVNGTGRFGAECLIGTNVTAGYYQDASNGAYRANGTTGNRGYYFQNNAGVYTTMYVGLVGTYAGRVGIGTTTPSRPLDVNGDTGAHRFISTSNLIGLTGSGLHTDGYPYARIVESWGISFQPQDARWAPNVVGSSFLVGFISNGANYGNGNILASGDVTAYASDKRLKKNIKTIDNALEKVLKLNGVTYNWDLDLCHKWDFYPFEGTEAGVLAQEVQEVLPEVVKRAPFDYDADENGNKISKSGENYLTVDYEKMVPLLIEAIKELKQEVNELKAQINGITN